jgi:hypothetical protein
LQHKKSEISLDKFAKILYNMKKAVKKRVAVTFPFRDKAVGASLEEEP